MDKLLLVKQVEITDKSVAIWRATTDNQENLMIIPCVCQKYYFDEDVRIINKKDCSVIKENSLNALSRIRTFLSMQEDAYNLSIYSGNIDEDMDIIEKMINEK